MALFVLPKVLSDLVKSFKAAGNGKVLAKSGDAWTFQDPTPDLSAGKVTVNTANFGGNLTASEASVQAALEKIDDLSLGSDPLYSTAEISVTGATTLTVDRRYVFSGTSADYTAPLPTLTEWDAGKRVQVRMSPLLTKRVTIDAGAGTTIDGVQTRIMWANEVAVLMWDGSAWEKIGGKSIPMQVDVSLAANTGYVYDNNTVTVIPNTTKNSDNAALYNTGTYRLTFIRPGTWSVSGSVAAASNTGNNLTRVAGYIYKNNAAYKTIGNVNGVSVSPGSGCSAFASFMAPFVAGDYIDLRGLGVSGGTTLQIGFNVGTYMTAVEQLAW